MAVTARTVPPAVVAIAVLAALPAFIARARGGHDMTGGLQFAAVLAGAAAGFAADDQAANVLAPSPTTLLTRRALRAVGVAVVLACGFGSALVLAVTSGGPSVALEGPLAVLAAAVGVAAALAGGGPTEGALAPGVSSALGAVVVLTTTSAMAQRWSWMPTLARMDFDGRWLVVAAAGAALALVRSRDPAGRRLPVVRRPISD